ncbi:MAG: double-strand break repair helicase AddA [Hyphomicrobiales bacterium]|nr:double-strand break repair helicase AddA [Hyphomicrobiales bacterium]
MTAASDIERIIRETQAAQAQAADPSACVWVSANAGTGKTYVLVRRVLRCLLSGAPPDSILCLTFTKAAAAEMSNRLIAELGRWAAAPADALVESVGELLGRAPDATEMEEARCLFVRVLDAPGGLKIMTIHSFCDRVLRRFPLEGGFAPGFSVMTDEEARDALREAAEMALARAASGADQALGAALKTVAACATEDSFVELLGDALRRKAQLGAILQRDDLDDPFEGMSAKLGAALGLSAGDTSEAIRARQCGIIPASVRARAADILAASDKVTDQELGGFFASAAQSDMATVYAALANAFLTKAGEPRSDKRFLTQVVRKAHPALVDTLTQARDEFATLERYARAAATVKASVALMRLANAAIEHYEDIKRERGAADYQDLIDKTLSLLTRQSAEWVLYQLDSGVRHVLIDEAQDTNPDQWRIVDRLTQEFFSGDGAAEHPRSVFAVGDEKQSIFGFQGAEPRRFQEMGRSFYERAKGAGGEWRDIPLTLSFRTVSPILRAVDLTFSGVEGLTAGLSEIRHAAHRQGDGGLVELWPTETSTKADKGDAWRPFDDDSSETPPQQRLAIRIADKIKRWLDDGEMLASQGRPVRPGDILILLRKREPFARLIIRACQERDIPVSGADRLKLASQMAVLDLLRLGDCLLQPADDLALATVLKGPFFGWSGDDLFAVAHGRIGSLWDALTESPLINESLAVAAKLLTAWREEAVGRAPYEFFAARLENDGYRKRFLARLGPEAGDALDEFLNLALAYETKAAPSMQGFLHSVRDSAVEVKRDLDQGRDDVRVMTVHGAKGLEANIVFLADTCSTRSRRTSAILDIPDAALPPTAQPLLCWAIPAAKTLPPVVAACETVKLADTSEYKRLLYVAMTRARDRLYITGYEGASGQSAGCWYDLAANALEENAIKIETDGTTVLRLHEPQVKPVKPHHGATAIKVTDALPDWVGAFARANQNAIFVQPSLVNPSALDGRRVPSGIERADAALKGVLTHKLLQYLPAMAEHDRFEAATAFLARESGGLPRDERDAVIASTLAILNNVAFAKLWGPNSRAEIAFDLALPASQGGPPTYASGQIDRLIITDHDVLIVDYKTGRSVPDTVAETPQSYLSQLALYRLAIKNIFPKKTLRAAILWTEKPVLSFIPEDMLDAAAQNLLCCLERPLDASGAGA